MNDEAYFKELDDALEWFKNHKVRQFFSTFEGLNYCLKEDLISIEEYTKQVYLNSKRLKAQVRQFRVKKLATIIKKYGKK
jgi:hypothetical protein